MSRKKDRIKNNTPRKKIGRSSYTLAEFLERNHLSRSTYYALRGAGLAPKEMRIGNALRFSVEAEKEWVVKMENGEAAGAFGAAAETTSTARDNAAKQAASEAAGEGINLERLAKEKDSKKKDRERRRRKQKRRERPDEEDGD